MNGPVSPVVPVALSGACFAVLGLLYKFAGATKCRPLAFTSVFLLVGMLFSGAAAFGPAAWADPRLWALGAGMGVAVFSAIALLVTVNRLGPASVTWTVINLSLLFTIFLARLALRERFLAADGLVLGLFVAMVFALARGVAGAHETAGRARTFWLLLAAVFVLNGLFAFGMKVKEVLFGAGSSAGLAVVFYGCGFALAFPFHLAASGRERGFTPAEWRAGVLAGACSGLGDLFFLAGMSLPAVVAFPVSQGISLLGGVLLTSLVYREHLNAAKVAGWLLGLLVLAAAVLREPISRWLLAVLH